MPALRQAIGMRLVVLGLQDDWVYGVQDQPKTNPGLGSVSRWCHCRCPIDDCKPTMNEDFLHIDQDQLDAEWLRQPEHYYRHARMLADAKELVARRKAAIELIAADLDKEIRDSPCKFGLGDKFTEAMVRSRVTLDERHQKAQRLLNKAHHDSDLCQAAVYALDHKKKALEKLVELHLANYFSTPRVPKGATRDDIEGLRKRKRLEGPARVVPN